MAFALERRPLRFTDTPVVRSDHESDRIAAEDVSRLIRGPRYGPPYIQEVACVTFQRARTKYVFGRLFRVQATGSGRGWF